MLLELQPLSSLTILDEGALLGTTGRRLVQADSKLPDPAAAHSPDSSAASSGVQMQAAIDLQVQARHRLQQSSSTVLALQALELGVLVDASGSTLYAPYGQPLPFSISPCNSTSQSSSGRCGVTAMDQQGNNLSGDVVTVSAMMQVGLRLLLTRAMPVFHAGWCVPAVIISRQQRATVPSLWHQHG